MRTMIPLFLALLGGDAEPRLAGSGVKIDTAVERSQIIVVAEMEGSRVAEPDPIESGRYERLTLRPSKSLAGGTGTGELTLEFPQIRAFPKEKAEQPLEKGVKYLFFIEQLGPTTTTTHYRAIKVLQATEANLDAVLLAQRSQVRWPGSGRSIYDASQNASHIVVGKFVNVGAVCPLAPPGATKYEPSRINVARSFRGELGDELAPTFDVVNWSAERAESLPIAGEDYVFFISSEPRAAAHVEKMLPATGENVRIARDVSRRLPKFRESIEPKP
jgi:hypothetical protein